MDQKARSAQELDYARCRGNWSAVPELARRYKQYHPEESVLESVALVEVDLYSQLLKERGFDDLELRRRSGTAAAEDALYQNDSPQQISLPPRLRRDTCQPIISRLQRIIQPHRSTAMSTTEERQAQLARIVLSRAHYEVGDFQLALNELNELALHVQDVSAGYGLVLLVQARAVKGTAQEMLGDPAAALQTFITAWDVVEKNKSEKNELLSYWIEECLYRGILLSLRMNAPPHQTLRLMRGYMHLAASNWTTAWHTTRQWIIYRAHVQYLAKDYSQRSTKKSAGPAPFDELNVLMSSLRKILAELTPRLDAQHLSEHQLNLVDTLVPAHEAIGWGDVGNMRAVLEIIHKAQKSSFNHPRLMRYQLLVLLRLGSFEEARHAFRSYVSLLGLPEIDIIIEESATIDTKDAEERAATLHRKRKGADGAADESWQDVVQTFLDAVELYGREWNNGKVAAGIADLALVLASKADVLLAQSHRTRGVAFGLLASQCDEPEIRATYHQQATASLEQAVALDDQSWASHYELAVQSAVIRDNQRALTAVTRSLQLNRNHLPSWHLLALLHSCKQYNHMPEALQTLETSLKDSSVLTDIPPSIHTLLPVLSTTGQENSRHYIDIAEAYLAIRTSQIQILEVLEGSEAVLNSYSELFALYGKMAQLLAFDSDSDTLVDAAAADTTEPSSPQDSSFASLNTNGVSRASSRARSRSGSGAALATGRQRSHSANGVGRRSGELQRQGSDAFSSPPSNPAIVRQARSNSNDIKGEKKQPSYSSDEYSNYTKSQRDRSMSLRKKSFQILEMGISRRIGGHSNGSIPNTRAPIDRRPSNTSAFSLASLLTPSFSVRSNSTSKTSTAFLTTAASGNNTFLLQQRERWHHQLIKLWLMSTTTFINAGRFDEATKAVMEAEQQLLIGHLNDASVWYQLGLVCIKKAKGDKKLYETGLDAFKKALAIDPNHVDTLVEMAECFIDLNEWEVAEGLLDRATQGQGWDNSRAWYLLGNCYRHHHERMDRAKECFLYALELEDTQPLQPYSILPRFVF